MAEPVRVSLSGGIEGMTYKHTRDGLMCVVKCVVPAADVDADKLRDLMAAGIVQFDMRSLQPRMFEAPQRFEERG